MKTTIVNYVAPVHVEIAAEAAAHFRKIVETARPAISFLFLFRSPIDRLSRFISIATTILGPGGRPLADYSLDRGLFVDVDTMQLDWKGHALDAVSELADKAIAEYDRLTAVTL